MRNPLNLCAVLLFCVLSFSAQSPTAGADPKVEELLKLKADYDPRTDGSPLVLLDAPQDGVAYYEMQKRATGLFNEKTNAEAEIPADQLARQYSRDPNNWRLLAFTKTRPGKFLEAVAAHRQAAKLIGGDLDFLYNEIKRVNADYRDKPFPAELERRYKELKAKIPKLSDEESIEKKDD